MNATVVAAPASVVFVQSQRTFADFADEFRRSQAIEPQPGPAVMPSGLFGPWVPGIPEPDRRAGLRALAALASVFCGSRDPVVEALRKAELAPEAADQALALFEKIPTRRRREILASYAAVMRPHKETDQ
jgi:hypothetical protein